MKTFILDSNNSLLATNEPLPPNFQRLTIESNILGVLEAEVSNSYCIVYPSFIRLLVNSIGETGQVASAQSSLLAAMEQMVYFYKRNRKHCTLLYLAEQNITTQRFSQPRILIELFSQISTKQNGVAELIATSSLLAHKEFSKRLTELESCSSGEVTFELQLNAQHAIDAVLSLQNENEQKLADMKAVLAKEQQAKCSEQKAAQKIQIETQKQYQELEQENTQIIEQLHNLQELFQEKLEQHTQTERKLADAETEIADMKAALTKEQQAKRSEQKAAQKIQIETQEQFHELEQENKQIIEQLHKVQELFQEKLEQHTQTERKLGDMKAALTKEQQENKQVIVQLNDVQELLEEKLEQLTQTEQKLANAETKMADMETALENEQQARNSEQKLFKAISQDRSAINKKLEKARLVQVWLRSALTKANHRLWSKSRTFRNEIKRQARILQESSEFVESQYLEMYPDTKTSSLEPSVHYIMFGAIEARNPSTTFSSLNYIHAYADVAESGQNPLLHYIQHGQFEGRKQNPMQLRLPAPKKG